MALSIGQLQSLYRQILTMLVILPYPHILILLELFSFNLNTHIYILLPFPDADHVPYPSYLHETEISAL